MVIALGVMNTAITTAASRLADKEQLGGFFGLLESVENVAGMIGPVLGGMLAGIEVLNATLVVVIGLYALAFALVGLFFEAHVTRAPVRTANKEEGSAPSTVAVGVKTKAIVLPTSATGHLGGEAQRGCRGAWEMWLLLMLVLRGDVTPLARGLAGAGTRIPAREASGL
eukprot:scaffold4433_cov35-Tisochrysis_lutea.AAC.6